MKKMCVCMLVVLISIGLVTVMAGCGGGGGGGGGLPKTSPQYDGPMNPAVIDTTNAIEYYNVASVLETLIYKITYAASGGTTLSAEGLYSGTAEFWYKTVEKETDTKYSYTYKEKWTYDNFVDDGSAWFGVLVGEGSDYYQWGDEVTETTYDILQHENFSAFYESHPLYREAFSGWVTYRWHEDETDWNAVLDADQAYHDFNSDIYIGVFGTHGDWAWNGSMTTWDANGELCLEGFAWDGCLNFDIDVSWDYLLFDFVEGWEEYWEDYPASGTAKYWTEDAAVMFAFGSSPSDPSCFLVSLDADGDGSYAGTDDWDEEEFCP